MVVITGKPMPGPVRTFNAPVVTMAVPGAYGGADGPPPPCPSVPPVPPPPVPPPPGGVVPPPPPAPWPGAPVASVTGRPMIEVLVSTSSAAIQPVAPGGSEVGTRTNSHVPLLLRPSSSTGTPRPSTIITVELGSGRAKTRIFSLLVTPVAPVPPGTVPPPPEPPPPGGTLPPPPDPPPGVPLAEVTGRTNRSFNSALIRLLAIQPKTSPGVRT